MSDIYGSPLAIKMLTEGMKEASQELPEIPVRKVVGKIAEKSQALLKSLTTADDTPQAEIIRHRAMERPQE